ncbi:hypothetical protein GCM10010422_01710 [Streptomyces graminearus]|uniref:Uncharacterized protein n=1 Tax=Streptomyces graminearus TaxID=284030 RepID=A0ABP5XQE2_9ACTN
MAGECGRGGVVEQQAAGQAQAGGGVELIAQFHRAERVEAEVLEGPLALDLAGLGVTENGGDMGADQVEHGLFACGLGQFGEPPAEGAERRGIGFGNGVGLRVCRGLTGGGRGGGEGGGGAVQPVPLPFERVGGECDLAVGASSAAEQGVPVRLQAVDVQCGDGRQQGGGLGAAGAQGGDEQGVAVGPRTGHGGEDATGAEFEIGAHALLVEAGDTVGEADRLAHMADPVSGIAPLVRRELRGESARHVGHDRDARGVEGQALGHLAELRQHGFHVRGVEGVADPQSAGLAAEGGEGVGDPGDEVLVAGDDDGVRAVQRGDADVVGVRADAVADLVLGGLDGDHGATGGQRLHQTAACGHQGAGVGEREDTGHVGGGEFADGVAHEHVGGDAPALQRPEQGDFEGEQRGLGVEGAVEFRRLLGAFGGEHHLAQRPRQQGVEVCAHVVQRGGERRYGLGQFAAHAGTLAALAREEEGEFAAGRRTARGQGRVDAVGGQRAQSAQEVLAVLADDDGPVFEGRTAHGKRPADVGQGERGVRLGVGQQGGGLAAQRGRGPGGQRPAGRGRTGTGSIDARLSRARYFRARYSRALAVLRVRVRRLPVFRQHDVAVGAAHAERADPGEQRAALLGGPGAVLGLHAQVQPVQRDRRVRCLEVEAGGQFSVVQREGRLEQAGDAGGALQVADVGLGRAHPQRVAGRASRAQHRAERGRLDGVADLGAGAVQLDVADVRGVDTGALAGEPEHLFLSGAQGHGQPVAAAVVVDGAAADHAVDGVAVRDGTGEGFEDDDAAALAADVAVGAGVEGEAAAVGGQSAELGGAQGAFGHEVETDATGEGDRRLALAQALAGQVDRDQGRGLAGVHGQAGAVQSEEVRDPVGDDAAVQTGDGVRGDGRQPGAVVQRRVVVPDGADEHPGTGGAQCPGTYVRVLQRLPGQLKDEPLLRVHRGGLLGGEPEEPGVEVADTVEEPAPADVGPPGLGRVGVGHRGPVPPVRGYVGDRVRALAEQPPEGPRVGGARQPACQTDDGDVTGRIRRSRTGPIPRPVALGLDHLHSTRPHRERKGTAPWRPRHRRSVRPRRQRVAVWPQFRSRGSAPPLWRISFRGIPKGGIPAAGNL